MPPREAMINREASAARGEFARVGIYVLTVVKNRSHARRMSDYLILASNFRPVFGMSRRPSDRRKST